MKYVYRYKKRIGDWTVAVEQRSRNNFMGRFGGGWQWRFGVQVGSTTAIFSYGVGSVIIRYRPQKT